MSKVYPFHTTEEEDHPHSPVYHDDDQCQYGKAIKKENKEYGDAGRNKCDRCIELNGK